MTAKNAGIDHIDKLDRVVLYEANIFVVGKTPGYLAKVDLNEPPPPLARISDALTESQSVDKPQPTQSPNMTR